MINFSQIANFNCTQHMLDITTEFTLVSSVFVMGFFLYLSFIFYSSMLLKDFELFQEDLQIIR